MKPLLLALLTGGLFALGLPPFDWEWLGWAALAPLLLAAQGRRPLEAFGLGMITESEMRPARRPSGEVTETKTRLG